VAVERRRAGTVASVAVFDRPSARRCGMASDRKKRRIGRADILGMRATDVCQPASVRATAS
jgi:hypothetical protein